jgi:curved DNA-binding protein CbpA
VRAALLSDYSTAKQTNNRIRMNGQLSENPPVELFHELLSKNLSGRLQLQHEKIKVAAYFQSGQLIYAASNVRTLRLAEYLLKSKLVTDQDLLHLGSKTKDLDLVRALTSEGRITAAQCGQLQARQVSDILRLALPWLEGTWEFDNRSHLSDEVALKIDVLDLILQTARRLPPDFVSGRFTNPDELFSRVSDPPSVSNLLPTEVFLLSRLELATPLVQLVAISGMPEVDALRIIYSLTVVGLIEREHWTQALLDEPAQSFKKIKPTPAARVEQSVPAEAETVESFLDRLSSAQSHYEVLGVAPDCTTPELKDMYYNLARKYHPDRFRTAKPALLSRIESAFARITQAYDALRNPGRRAAYDSKLKARSRAAKLAESAPKAQTPVQEAPGAPVETKTSSPLSPVQLAEIHFKDGFAALELGQRNVALGLLGSAARAVPDEPRYRAYYGRVLALSEGTRRLAEAELQAAVKLEPNNAEYRIMLAELYRDLGFLVRAKGEAERAVAADRDNRNARDLLRSLT